MRTRRRDIEGISLSFLDVISCGFGALILMLVLTKVFEPVIFEETIADLEGYLAALQEDLFEIRGETDELNRELIRKEDRQADELERLAQLKARLEALQSRYDTTVKETKLDNVIEGRLAKAKQSLTEEMQRLLKDFQKAADDNKIGGIPVDSEYVIFIIDTSGSMRQFAWDLLIQKMQETLDVYPRLKGIQVMDDQGGYLFSQYAGEWIPDTQARRQKILERMQSWEAFSDSSPEQGIIRAISTFYEPGKKISLFVMGDDFRPRSIKPVVDIVDRINLAGATGERLVRIHGVGFPVNFQEGGNYEGAVKFAHLMRILCERNGGTFVGLNDFDNF